MYPHSNCLGRGSNPYSPCYIFNTLTNWPQCITLRCRCIHTRKVHAQLHMYLHLKCPCCPVAETWRRVLGGRKMFSRTKIHYFRKEFLDDTFFTLFVISSASDNTTSQNIGGRMHGRPPPLFFGGTVPSPPRSSSLVLSVSLHCMLFVSIRCLVCHSLHILAFLFYFPCVDVSIISFRNPLY